MTAAGILSPGPNSFTLTLPADTIPGSGDLTLKLYPNLAAHLRDALAAMAGYPSGCAARKTQPSDRRVVRGYRANLSCASDAA